MHMDVNPQEGSILKKIGRGGETKVDLFKEIIMRRTIYLIRHNQRFKSLTTTLNTLDLELAHQHTM